MDRGGRPWPPPSASSIPQNARPLAAYGGIPFLGHPHATRWDSTFLAWTPETAAAFMAPLAFEDNSLLRYPQIPVES